MGLEGVEIVMAVEERFDIVIADAEAELLVTPRDIIDCVMRKLGAPPGQWSREQVAIQVRKIVTEHLGCESQYREDAEFVKDLGMG
jgi:acyl carrier protein